jgi:hypothetical protein
MNIFVLHKDPRIAARMHCDKHVQKMIIEHAQMMAAAYYSTIGISRKKEIPFKHEEVNELFKGWPRKNADGTEWHYSISHVNHPCTIWTRHSKENFEWLLECTDELCLEFSRRWNGSYHSVSRIVDWMKQNPPRLPSLGLTEFAQAMPACFRSDDPINSYRRYYGMKTSYMNVTWKKLDNHPQWWNLDFAKSCVDVYQQFITPQMV